MRQPGAALPVATARPAAALLAVATYQVEGLTGVARRQELLMLALPG